MDLTREAFVKIIEKTNESRAISLPRGKRRRMGRLITWELQLELQYDWQVKILFYNLVDIILES